MWQMFAHRTKTRWRVHLMCLQIGWCWCFAWCGTSLKRLSKHMSWRKKQCIANSFAHDVMFPVTQYWWNWANLALPILWTTFPGGSRVQTTSDTVSCAHVAPVMLGPASFVLLRGHDECLEDHPGIDCLLIGVLCQVWRYALVLFESTSFQFASNFFYFEKKYSKFLRVLYFESTFLYFWICTLKVCMRVLKIFFVFWECIRVFFLFFPRSFFLPWSFLN